MVWRRDVAISVSGRDQEVRVWNCRTATVLSTRPLRRELERGQAIVARGSGVGVVEMSDRYLLYGQVMHDADADAVACCLLLPLLVRLLLPDPATVLLQLSA